MYYYSTWTLSLSFRTIKTSETRTLKSCISCSTSQSHSSLQLHRHDTSQSVYHQFHPESPSAPILYTIPSHGPSLTQYLKQQWLDKHRENHLCTQKTQVGPYTCPECNTYPIPCSSMTSVTKTYKWTPSSVYIRFGWPRISSQTHSSPVSLEV